MKKREVRRVVVALALAIALVEREAAACGVFVTETAPSASRLPYLTDERVLIVWDKDSETEDFVREARFDQANRAFGFVVPVPSRPEVSTVEGDLFDELADGYPFRAWPKPGMDRAGIGAGGAVSVAQAPVEVVAHERIGDFTASVLTAADGGGLEAWLREHGFGVEEGGRAWIDHYVRLGFYYVAFPYAGSADHTNEKRLVSRAFRIRFKTPVAFYPYSEPSGAAKAGSSRLLEAWFASQQEAWPVAMHTSTSGPQWVRPWEGARYPKTQAVPTQIRPVTGLLPSTQLYVTSFRDAKLSRAGWGDVLLLPVRLGEDDDVDIAKRWPLMGVLDPRLDGQVHASPLAARELFPATKEEPVRAESPLARRASEGSCAVLAGAPARENAWGWTLLAALARACRRRTAHRSPPLP